MPCKSGRHSQRASDESSVILSPEVIEIYVGWYPIKHLKCKSCVQELSLNPLCASIGARSVHAFDHV